MLYDIVKKDILKNKQIKKDGKFIGIPIPFTRLAQYIPITERGHSIGLLSATGAGKSRLLRFLYIYHSYKFAKEHDYPLRILYFPLEDSKEKVYRNMICHYLYELYGIYINLQELDSKGNRMLPDFVEEKLIEAKDFFKDFEKIVTVVDGMNEPTQIFNYCQNYALRTGIEEEFETEVEGEMLKQKRYVPNNDVHTLILVDNMSNISLEKGTASDREAIVKFCRDYVRGVLCNYYNFTVVQVLQQDFQTERQSFTRDGDSIIEKLKPSLAGIGDAKTIARSMHLVFGLFHPVRYNIQSYPPVTRNNPDTYRLDILGNRFRSLSILKANDTDFGMEIALNFDAVSEKWTEFPASNSPEIEQIYERIRQKNPEKFSKIRETTIHKNNDDEQDQPF